MLQILYIILTKLYIQILAFYGRKFDNAELYVILNYLQLVCIRLSLCK